MSKMRPKLSYAIWLMPEGKLNEQLFSIIESFHRKYSSPVFKPHVTLAWPLLDSEENLIQKAQLLAKSMKSFNVTLYGISRRNEFFVSLFLNVRRYQQLMQARKRAVKTFNLNEEGYMPHMSLAYGNFKEETKNTMEEEIEIHLPISFKVKRIHMVFNDEENLKWKIIRSFEIRD